MRRLWNRAFADAPDVLGVLRDGAVAAELAAPGRAQDGHLQPPRPIPIHAEKRGEEKRRAIREQSKANEEEEAQREAADG